MVRNWKVLAASLGLLIGVSGPASAQGWSQADQDRDDRGMMRQDDEHRRDQGWRNRGYGYQDHDRDRDDSNRDRDRDRDHDRNRDRHHHNRGQDGSSRGGDDSNRGSSRNQASRIGYEDGLRDGQNDRRTGHSFRPTHDDNYKNADRGYSSSYGDKDGYKQSYRSGYEQGYNTGYRR